MQKAARLGIAESFTDATGHRRAITREALERLMVSLPVPPERRILPSSLISRGGPRASCGLPEHVQLPLRWTVLGANGTAEAEGSVDARTLALPSLPEGIHRLRVRDESGAEEDVNLLTVPERAFGGTFDRVWILAVQLYSVRSARNWGIGDFTDLKELLRWSARHGAAGVGLNPLHALFDDHPQDCSPYSPNSRLFLNPLYIDVARLPGCPASFVAIHTSGIERARVEDFVDYRRVAELKHEAMRLAFSSFKITAASDRQRDFDDYRRAEGARLSRFACFEMLRRKYAGPWRDWPDDWSSPDDDALLALRQGPDADAIEFVEYQQWIAHAQLSECRDLATELGMPIGLYLDIAVGVKADGFDAWNEQVAISRNLSVGAPPDLLNTAGQDWGLAGFNAAGLDMRSYEPFADLLRASMRYAGAIRLDHVLGLNRIYLVPEGCSPREGAYVRMPLEDLLAVTALAAWAI